MDFIKKNSVIAYGNDSKTNYCKPTNSIRKKSDKTFNSDNSNTILVYEITGDNQTENVENATHSSSSEAPSITLDLLFHHFLEQRVQIDAIHVKLDRLLQAGGLVTVEETNENLNFPLKTLNDIHELEENLKNENYRKHLEKILHLVGGADSAKLIRRCLARIFTDRLACQCSFTGAKENFRVKDLILIQEVHKVVRQNFPETSDYDFEKVVKDFFRYAGQRLKISTLEVGKIKRRRGNIYGAQ